MGEQKDRMLRNEWYLDEQDLVEDRRRCWRLLDRFNATTADDDLERRAILEELLGQIGAGSVIMPRLQCSYGQHTRLGANVFINSDALLMDDPLISIDDDVRIGPALSYSPPCTPSRTTTVDKPDGSGLLPSPSARTPGSAPE